MPRRDFVRPAARIEWMAVFRRFSKNAQVVRHDLSLARVLLHGHWYWNGMQ